MNEREIMDRLTLGQRAALRSGAGSWQTKAVEGVPALLMSDGPHGIRKLSVSSAVDMLVASPYPNRPLASPQDAAAPAAGTPSFWDGREGR